MRLALIVVVLAIAAAPSPAHADDNLENWLIGPVLGVRLGGGGGAILGVEGGGGFGPERFNLGFEHRSDHDVYYAEIDPWYLIGGTIGVGVTDKGDAVPVLGLWEGFPLNGGSCTGWHDQLTISGGYRYTGVHELYVSVKAGRMQGEFCWD
jgi:hypothetical protein